MENITITVLESFLNNFSKVKCAYKKTRDVTELKNEIEKIAEEYHAYFGVGDLILAYGEELISSGAQDAGIAILKVIDEQRVCIANQTLFCMRLAENAFNNGNIEECRSYLLLLCENLDNYEDSIKANDLQDVWDRCKHVVENDICKSDSLKPRAFGECSISINEILQLPQDELITAMFEHLDELSANGKRLELLSEQEVYVFLIFEFVEAVNSDGLEQYFSYNAERFMDLHQAFCVVDCVVAKALWESIKDKLLALVDKQEEASIEKALLRIADFEMDFEREETLYYKKVEKKLLRQVYRYILKNASCFK